MATQAVSSPHVYLHTHVRNDGSVKLDGIVGTAHKFDQVREDCRTLRANPKVCFEEFRKRSEENNSLDVAPEYLRDGTPTTCIKWGFDPLKSRWFTALLTDEFQSQLQEQDDPREALRTVMSVEIRTGVVWLRRSDDRINYRFSPLDKMSCAAFENALSDEKYRDLIQPLISQFIKGILDRSSFFETGYLVSSKWYHLIAPTGIKAVFQSALWKTGKGEEILKITDLHFVDKEIREGREWHLLVFHSIPASQEEIQTTKSFLKGSLTAILLKIHECVEKNLPEYRNLTEANLKNRTYTRSPKVVAIAKAGKLYDLLEPRVLLWRFCFHGVSRCVPALKDLPTKMHHEIAEEMMVVIDNRNSQPQAPSNQKNNSSEKKEANQNTL